MIRSTLKMRPTSLLVLALLSFFFVVPGVVSAQEAVTTEVSTESTEDPNANNGGFLLPGADGSDAPVVETPAEDPERDQRNFITGAAAGAAVGLVVGGAAVWFLKPEER